MNNRNTNFKVGQTVEIVGKHLEGRIAYIGVTNFAPGRWIGVVLNEARGKNNGQVRGISYFKCDRNYGIFVRPTQLIMKKATSTVLAEEEMPRTQDSPIREAVKAREVVEKPEQQENVVSLVGGEAGKQVEKSQTAAMEVRKIVTPPPPAPEIKHETNKDGPVKPKDATAPTSSTLMVKKVPKMPTSINLLKTTKINQPKEVTPLQPSTSQISLHNISGPLRNLRPPPALAPKRSKTSMSPSESFCCAKRSSFVETGFLEILRPQFTPGQPIRSPTFSSMALNSSSATNLNDLKQQQKQMEVKLKEFEEEIEQLKSQKSEDKRKLQSMERLRLQNEQLLEFKVRIMDQQTNLQRELTRLRQELRECQEMKSKYQRDLDEAAENIELLTLDKEMAEERAETLQLELELAQEQNEELSLDVEILKAENERFLCGENGENNAAVINKEENLSSHGEIRKLEQYNQRLRETVIKLRDVLTEEKQLSMKASKELETKNSEILELKKTKELLTQRCDVMESHIIDLREQVDAALGAETMVATLADAKLELEDRVRLLEEEVSELEALEEIHEQLIESNQELERDLREEIDLLNGNIRTLQQEKDAALETVYERDCTIMKFRALVKTLNEREQIKEQMALTTAASTTATASTSEELNSISSSNQEFMPGVDFQQIFASTKAYGRALELQLASVELKMVQLQNEYLKAFLPEELMLRGGAYDVILILIVLQRCMEKIDIICSGIHEKFPASCEFGRDAIFEGYSVHRFAFRTRCLYLLRSLKMILQQLDFALNHCDYEICTHAAIYRGEMEAQEKQLDELLRLLKKGLLDENTPVEALEGASSFFNSLLNNLFASQNLAELLDEQKLYGSLIEVYDVALDCVNTHAGLLYTIIQLGDEQTDSFCSMQFLMEHVRAFKQQLKQLQRKLPNKTITYSTLQWPQLQRLHERNDYLGRLIGLLSSTAREATKDIANTSKSEIGERGNNDIAIDHERLWRIISFNCNKMAPEGYQKSPVEFFQNSIAILQEQLDEFQQFIKDSEKALSKNLNTTYVRSEEVTILQQANEVKKHYEEIKLLHHHISERDKEIKSLKYMAKMKQNDYSELQIRKDMAEKQLHKQQQDYTELMQQITEKMEELLEDLQSKQIKLLNSLDNNSAKLEKLERMQVTLKQSMANSSQTHTSCSHDSLREIENLSLSLKQQRDHSIAIQSKHLKMELRKLEPLHVPPCREMPQKNQNMQEEIKQLQHELNKLKKSWILGYIQLNNQASRSTTSAPSSPTSTPTPSSSSAALQRESRHLFEHILDTYYRSHPHRQIPTDFGQFPCRELKELFE
ncbi:dynactin subunit 1-like [Musca vetustissima]|uniref:dynactin subunit 1-like n=1 Tax=Musca vetustissima TaxID=27455 RepID=UPI002AB76ECC|nr:dynactin subunit 1-like [Musca vetustissima]